MNTNGLQLPPAVVSQHDINRILRELGALEDFFLSANVRSAGTSIKPPKVSFILEQTARANKHNLLEPSHRANLRTLLENVSKTAPVLHISFAAEPSAKFTDTIIGWLRSNIHPQTLLVIGLQPTLAAGCVLRTGNRIFDMSLRSHLQKQEPYMVKLIQGAVSAKR